MSLGWSVGVAVCAGVGGAEAASAAGDVAAGAGGRAGGSGAPPGSIVAGSVGWSKSSNRDSWGLGSATARGSRRPEDPRTPGAPGRWPGDAGGRPEPAAGPPGGR